jgi:acetylornithine deacetylase/succinyl-diaminopimelate desuccinylase-like protein
MTTDIWLRRAHALHADPVVGRACAIVAESDSETLADQVALAEIPAPSFQEGARGERIAALLSAAGCEALETDTVGNVTARMGPADGRPLVLSAHLDTVFPAEIDVSVSRRDGRLEGPGISDDARGLAALVAMARSLHRAGIQPASPLLFAATVCEEGAGNLRGVRHLFREAGPGAPARGFISLDGAGLSRIVTRGLGSRRLRATVRGAGGHSWTDWGTPNPIHALGGAVGAIARLPLAADPPVTATVARWGGGTSINAIPAEAWVEMDMRSESPELLEDVETQARRALHGAVDRTNGAAPAGRALLALEITTIGDRPPGRTAPDTELVQAAVAATRTLGVDPELIASSTDANVPMSVGVPAVTLGAGGEAGGAHTLDEWYRNDGGPDGVVRALLTALLVVGVQGG